MADEKKPDSDDANQLGIYYQRSRHYRTVHADGAQFGVTPRGTVQFTLFTDQKPMPEYVLHRITPEGNLGASIEEVVKEGAIREVEINVIMDMAVAINFVNAFQGVLAQIKSIQEQAEKIVAARIATAPASEE
jgi:hypothetical protein